MTPIPSMHKGKPVVAIATRDDWRAWLAGNHARKAGVWVAYPRQSTGAGVRTVDLVEESLCFGWIDSLPNKLSDTHSLLYIAPRNPRSRWSAVNKAMVERLLAAGKMHPAGLAMVELAQRTGTWTALDDVDALIVPEDLRAALAADPAAERYFAAFPPSIRRGILEWILDARTPATRSKRLAETVRLAARNIRANTPAARGQ